MVHPLFRSHFGSSGSTDSSGPTRHALLGSIERTVVHPRGPTRYRDDDDNDDDDDDEDDEDDEGDDNDDDDVFIAI